jgi:hypothetical protein
MHFCLQYSILFYFTYTPFLHIYHIALLICCVLL